jgi:hypothetical protein
MQGVLTYLDPLGQIARAPGCGPLSRLSDQQIAGLFTMPMWSRFD